MKKYYAQIIILLISQVALYFLFSMIALTFNPAHWLLFSNTVTGAGARFGAISLEVYIIVNLFFND